MILKLDSRSRSFVLTLLLAVSLVCALVLESSIVSGFAGELVFILVACLASIGVLLGVWLDAQWAFPAGTLVFAAGLANLLWLGNVSFVAFALGMLVNVVGLLWCIISYNERPSLETYDISLVKNAFSKPKRRGRPRKNA